MRAPIEYMHAPFHASAGASAEGELYGAASISDALFESPTSIQLGAFLLALGEETDPIEVWWGYKIPEGIGRLTMVLETLEPEGGLMVRGKIRRTRRGEDALALLGAGVVEELRIGFAPLAWEMVRQPDGSNVRHITSLQVLRVDVGTFVFHAHERSRAPSSPPLPPSQYVIVSAEAVPPATRAIVMAALRRVSEDLALPELAPLRWVLPMEGVGGDPQETFWSSPSLRGAVRLLGEGSDLRPVIHLRADFTMMNHLIEVVAHECRHVDQITRCGLTFDSERRVDAEADAQEFGREFAWRYPELIASLQKSLEPLCGVKA